MSKLRLLFLAAPLLFVLCIGCAGTPGSGIGIPIFYAHTYDGPYTGSAGDNGNMDIKVDSLGSITGTVTDDKLNETGDVTTGSINNNGNINMTVTFPNNVTDSYAGNVHLNTSDDQLQGTITETGNESQQVMLALPEQ